MANRKREQQNKAQGRVRTVQSRVHSAIGQVLSDAAELKELSPIQLLGLANYLAQELEKPQVLDDIWQRGILLYKEHYMRAESLCMLGAGKSKNVAEALRAAGFVRIGDHWAGHANISKAISIALDHGLTLLRHEAHDVIYYIKKGVRQLALADLEAEHAAMQAQLEAFRSTPGGEVVTRGEGEGPDAANSANIEERASAQESDPDAGGRPVRDKAATPASASQIRFGRPGGIRLTASEPGRDSGKEGN